MAKAIFVTGTGTDVGKTYVTGLLLKKMNEMGKKAAYYKAAMSGNERDSEGNLIPGDAVSVRRPPASDSPWRKCVPIFMKTPTPRTWRPASRAARWRWTW